MKRLEHVPSQDIAGEFTLPHDIDQTRRFKLLHVMGQRRRVDPCAIADGAAGQRVMALAKMLQDFVTAPIAQGFRDQEKLILRQRYANRL